MSTKTDFSINHQFICLQHVTDDSLQGEHSMKNGTVMKISVTVAAALLAAVLMTLLSAVPPLSYLHDWAESNHMMFLWNGLTAGAAALRLSLYHYHLQR